MATITTLRPKLEWVVFNARSRRSDVRPYIESSYRMWHQVWVEAFEELEGTSALPSDDFTRHDQVAVLFANGVPIGSVFFSVVNLQEAMWRRDSYFKVWPQELLVGLGEKYPGDDVLVCCYFTVSQEWRRQAGGLSAKWLLGGLSVEHFKHSGCNAMVGTMRVNKGMHKLCYDLGAEPLQAGVMHHGVEVDLIVFDGPTLPKTLSPEDEKLVEDIFSRRIDFTNEGTKRIRKSA